MSASDQEYKHTGKNVSVSREDLMNAVHERLSEYDVLNNDQKSKLSNPYVDPVFVKTSDNKTVQVPRCIQNSVVMKWKTTKGSSHTRLDNSNRYVFNDPYVMNQDLKDKRSIGGYEPSCNDSSDRDYMEYGSPVSVSLDKKKCTGNSMNSMNSMASNGATPRDIGLFDADINIDMAMEEEQNISGYSPDDTDNNCPVTGCHDTRYQSKDQSGCSGIKVKNIDMSKVNAVNNMGNNRMMYKNFKDQDNDYAYNNDIPYGIIEGMDAEMDEERDEECDVTYKYMFYLLLLAIIFTIYVYKKNNGTGLF
jgi:hypothetical protein